MLLIFFCTVQQNNTDTHIEGIRTDEM